MLYFIFFRSNKIKPPLGIVSEWMLWIVTLNVLCRADEFRRVIFEFVSFRDEQFSKRELISTLQFYASIHMKVQCIKMHFVYTTRV